MKRPAPQAAVDALPPATAEVLARDLLILLSEHDEEDRRRKVHRAHLYILYQRALAAAQVGRAA